jgi:asparagine synthase (glutamine-hydrolysing)
MCGLNGIYCHKNQDNAKNIIEKMNETLAHRGPNDGGVWTDEMVALGHKRLSIIDISSAGHQPKISENERFVIVFNGEIYNYRKLREKLQKEKGITFNTETDTEVLLNAFITYGKSCLNMLEGMFAFAVWDKLKRELFIARDRLGIKPLYYLKKDNTIAFSSEIRPLIKSGLSNKKIDFDGLVDYMRYQTVHAPKTIIEDISMLMPGHYMIINDDDFIIEEFWSITNANPLNYDYSSYETVTKNVRKLLFEAVEKRLVADVPLGAFLSGGVDSSAIVAIMSQINSAEVNTFNISFDDKEFDESKYAQLIADKYKTNHIKIKLSANDFLDELPNALNAIDHPSGDGPNTFVVSKHTKQAGLTIALSGLGGDELFAGYDVFKRLYSLPDKKWIFSFPKQFRSLAGNILCMAKPGVSSEKIKELLVQDYLELAYTYPINRKVLMDDTIYQLLGEKLPPNSVHEFLLKEISFRGRGFKLPLLSKIGYAEITSYMQNVLLRDSDQMGMAHALEIRVPFLDHSLVEYMTGVPDEFKYPHYTKKLLIDSLSDLIPKEIYDRPKMGFVFPWKNWLKNELKDIAEENIKRLAARSFIDEKQMNKLWTSFLSDDPKVTWSRVWPLIVLEHWIEKNLN